MKKDELRVLADERRRDYSTRTAATRPPTSSSSRAARHRSCRGRDRPLAPT